jgi:hypothetical protein
MASLMGTLTTCKRKLWKWSISLYTEAESGERGRRAAILIIRKWSISLYRGCIWGKLKM